MYSIPNERELVVAESLIKMTANYKKSYLGYFNKLVDKFNRSYYRSIGKKPTGADYSPLTEKIELSLKTLKYKVGNRLRITKYKNIFSKI